MLTPRHDGSLGIFRATGNSKFCKVCGSRRFSDCLETHPHPPEAPVCDMLQIIFQGMLVASPAFLCMWCDVCVCIGAINKAL